MKKIVLALLIVFSFNVFAEEKDYGDVIVSTVVTVHDGDTFSVMINKWPTIVGDKILVRVDGVDTPEILGQCQKEKDLAQKAKLFTQQFLNTDKRIYLKHMRRDKYFRILADVQVNGKLLSQELINNGLARPYHGEKKQSWCVVDSTSTAIASSVINN